MNGTIVCRVIGVPTAICELFSADGELLAQLAVEGEYAFSELAPGRYLVRARTPAGEYLSQSVDLAADAWVEVELHAAASPHEWLREAQAIGQLPVQMLVRPPSFEAGVGPDLLIPEPKARAPLGLRLWEFQDQGWQVAEQAQLELRGHDPLAQISTLALSANRDWLNALQLWSEDLPSRCVLLPPGAFSIEGLIRPARRATNENGGMALKIYSSDQSAEALLRFLNRGAVRDASVIGSDLADRAEMMLMGKMSNPFGAIVAGYLLLRSADYARLHDWPNNLANWFPNLPDGALIHASQLLADRDAPLSALNQPAEWLAPFALEPRLALARWRLLQAAASGGPAYSMGVRWLIDGLERFAAAARQRQLADPLVDTALIAMRRHASRMDWSETLTTLSGERPDGHPAAPDSAVHLWIA